MMTENDSGLMLDLDSDPEVMRYITNGKTTTPKDMRDIYIPRMKSYTNHDKGWGIWKVFRKEDDLFIGWYLLRPHKDKPQEVEIGWRFKKAYWGNGYGTEGAKLFVGHVFKQDNISKVWAIALPENLGSRKIMEKIGMTYVKTYTHNDPLFKEDVVLYELESLSQMK